MRYLELVLIDALLHLQSLFDIEIDELTVLITYDTVGLAFQHDIYCVAASIRRAMEVECPIPSALMMI